MRPCTLEDFGGRIETDYYHQSWHSFTFLCPETVNSEGRHLTLNGSWGMNQTSKIEYRVDRCNSEFFDCESEENIDKMLRDLRIQTWIVN